MDIPNAFIGHADQPTPTEVSAAIGATAELWEELVSWIATEMGVVDQEWSSSSPKHGWSLRFRSKKRTILYLSPCAGCFRAAFALGDRAVAVARDGNLPKAVIQAIEAAPRYAEGTGVRILVRKRADLSGIRKLATIKLAN